MSSHPIRAFRNARGLTQKTFGASVEVGVNTVSRWENGERYPSPAETLRIRKATAGVVTEVELLEWWEKACSPGECKDVERASRPQGAE